MIVKNKFINVLVLGQWLLFSILIYYFSSLSRIAFLPPKIWDYDKIVHFSIYFFYGLSSIIFVYRFFVNKYNISKILFFAVLIGVIFAASDEFHQSFTPNRNSDFYDFFADSLGIFLSVLIFNLILKNWKKRKGIID